jgi:hypothetical protein
LADNKGRDNFSKLSVKCEDTQENNEVTIQFQLSPPNAPALSISIEFVSSILTAQAEALKGKML